MSRTHFLFVTSLFLLAGCSSSSGGGAGGGGTGGTASTSTSTSTSTSSGAGGGACEYARECPCGPVMCQFSCDGCDKPCDPATPCPPGFWCDYPDNACGAGQAGTCRQNIGYGCGESGQPRVCTCGGAVVPGDCPGVIVSADVSADPALCSDGTFPCGNLACKNYLEYCETTLPGLPGSEPSYACKTSSACKIPDCYCVPGIEPATCEMVDGQMKVTIALP